MAIMQKFSSINQRMIENREDFRSQASTLDLYKWLIDRDKSIENWNINAMA